MELTQVVGIAAGVLTSLSLVPQLAKIIREKEADDVSVSMLIILTLGLGTWVVYGILRKDLPIIITNSFSFLINTTVLILRIKYAGNK